MQKSSKILFQCSFNRAILHGTCACSMSHTSHIAERYTVNCTSEQHSKTCIVLIKNVFEKSKFVLKTTLNIEALPNAKKLQLQLGCLLGTQKTLLNTNETVVHDVCKLVLKTTKTYHDNLPFVEIINTIRDTKPRRVSKKVSHTPK